jgi:hypothetical protein
VHHFVPDQVVRAVDAVAVRAMSLAAAA